MSSIDTMQYWAKIIGKVEDIPPDFSDSFNSQIVKPSIFPYTVFFPVQTRFFSFSKSDQEKIISFHNGIFYIFENQNGNIRNFTISPDDICYIEKGKILLNSWLRIYGLSNGRMLKVKFDYNTTNENIIDFIIEKVRDNLYRNKKSDIENEKSKLRHIEKLSFKLANYSEDILCEGIDIKKTIYQKSVKLNSLKFLYRNLAEFILILTDDELIILRDSYSRFVSKFKYGITYSFIQIKKIDRMTIKNFEVKPYLELTINFDDDTSFKNIFEPENEKDVIELVKNMPDAIKKKISYFID